MDRLPDGPTEFTLGRSVEGRQIRCLVLGSGPDTVMVLGSIHGNEAASGRLVDALANHLQAHPEALQGCRAVLVAEVNPDGIARHSRYNARGIDLNRNFPSINHENGPLSGDAPLTEPESKAIARLIDRCAPARILSVHAPLGCVDFDGPADGLALAISSACGLRLSRIGGQPGSLGSFAGEDRGIPVVTLELSRTDGRRDGKGLWSRYGPALLAALEGGEPLPDASMCPAN